MTSWHIGRDGDMRRGYMTGKDSNLLFFRIVITVGIILVALEGVTLRKNIVTESDWLLLSIWSESTYDAFIVLHRMMASASTASPQPTKSHSALEGLPNFSFGNCAFAMLPQATNAISNNSF